MEDKRLGGDGDNWTEGDIKISLAWYRSGLGGVQRRLDLIDIGFCFAFAAG